jgi:hypothetical protein
LWIGLCVVAVLCVAAAAIYQQSIRTALAGADETIPNDQPTTNEPPNDGPIQFAQFAAQPDAKIKTWTLEQIPFNGARAYEYLKKICEIGARVSGSEGMTKQQQLLEEHFTRLGGKVSYQKFTVAHPQTRERTPMANMIVEWKSDAPKRILLCAHYDTRPFPDRDPDPRKRRDVFLGANDGASGTAALMEMAHEMATLRCNYGVDFVLFDGEELVYDENRDDKYYFIGSTWFAKQYVQNPPAHRYRWGVLLDMVADANLQIFYEQNSVKRRNVKPLVEEIWSVAAALEVGEFYPVIGYELRDDHLPLNDIAKIPTCDVIDFDYPHPRAPASYWHTTADVPENCSALSLAKVGWVVKTWLEQTR